MSGYIQELATALLKHKRLYYAGKPEISDEDYDALEEKLRKLEPQHPVLSYVGAEPAVDVPKVTHERPMLSLNKTYSKKELKAWQNANEILGTLKIDGNSLSLVYENGQLKLAKTRGNGRIGEDVTAKAKWVPSIPKRVSLATRFEVRGELYCEAANFAKLCQEMEARDLERPTSPRNIVAGILGRKLDYDLANYFDFYAFDFLDYEQSFSFISEEQKFSHLQTVGFRTPRYEVIKDDAHLDHFLDSVLEEMEVGSVSLDGAVFSYNNLNMHEELGSTAHHPRYKISFKWQGETATSVIKRLHWATSRHGIVTPVAVIEPVELSGARITNITLHNAAMVRTYNLKKGDKIELVRSGEVIPKFLRVVTAADGEYVWPSQCPACDHLLTFDEVRLVCPNSQGCPAQQTGQILNWIKSVGIDDLSEKRLEHMMDIGFVATIPDLYRITEEDMLQLPLTKEKMARKLYANIQKSRDISLVQFLRGLGIPGAGATTWEKVLARFPTLSEVQNLTATDLIALDGFAEKSAEQIVGGLETKKHLISELLVEGITPRDAQVSGQGGSQKAALAGSQLVITGALSKPRGEIAAMIKQAGGKVATSVSSNTTAVVTNEPGGTSSKMKKARELGIEVWSESELIERINREL